MQALPLHRTNRRQSSTTGMCADASTTLMRSLRQLKSEMGMVRSSGSVVTSSVARAWLHRAAA